MLDSSRSLIKDKAERVTSKGLYYQLQILIEHGGSHTQCVSHKVQHCAYIHTLPLWVHISWRHKTHIIKGYKNHTAVGASFEQMTVACCGQSQSFVGRGLDACKKTHKHTHTHTHTRTHTCKHTRARTHKHTCTHTHARTYTHTHLHCLQLGYHSTFSCVKQICFVVDNCRTDKFKLPCCLLAYELLIF